MGFKEIVERILSIRPDLTKEEVFDLVEKKRKEAEGYFTDEGAARVIASELGVDPLRRPFQDIMIRDLVSGLNDVTLTGRVIIVYPPQLFTRRFKKKGKVARLRIADKSGMLKVVLWDAKVSFVEDGRIEQGQIVRISHGYVREGLDGKFEVHVGLRGGLQISPPDAVDCDYPSVASFLQKIGGITRKCKEASVLGIVDRVHPVSTFERRDGRLGKVRRLTLRDETGELNTVFWDKKVDELGNVKPGSFVRIMDARVRESLDGRVEIHTKKTTQIETLPERSEHLTLRRFTKMKELKPGMRNIKVLARVTEVGKIRKIKRWSGELGYVSALLIKDETGIIRLNLWEEKATLFKEIKSGNIVLVDGAYVQERFGETNLNVGKLGVLTLNPKLTEVERLPPHEEKTTTIAELRAEGGPLTVEGTIATKPIVREVSTARGERVAVSSFEFMDSRGEIVPVSLWRELADTVKDAAVGTRMKIRNVYVKVGQADQLELISRMLTSVEIFPKQETLYTQRGIE